MAGNVPKVWVPGDLNGFFGLFTNSLTNVLATVFLLTVPLGFPPNLVFGRIIPGLVLSIAVRQHLLRLDGVAACEEGGA